MSDEADVIRQIMTADTSQLNGDDAAIVAAPGAQIAITTDTSVLGLHALGCMSAEQFGVRAVARALSDVAAMAMIPAAVVVALIVPDDGWRLASRVLDGARSRARSSGTDLVGGDLSGGDTWTAVVTCVGRRAATLPRTRAGVRAGDELYVTGRLGAAALALEQLRHIDAELANRAPLSGDGAHDDSGALDAYLCPPDRLRAARALAPFARAMIDVSDGVASDARHLAECSGVCLHIDLDALPRAASCDAVRAATHGDDYELCVAIAPGDVPAARAALAAACPDLPLTKIGSAADDRLVPGVTFTLAGEPIDGLTGHIHG